MLIETALLLLLTVSAIFLAKWRRKKKALDGLPGLKPWPLLGSVRDITAFLAFLGKKRPLHPLVRLLQIFTGLSVIHHKEKLFQLWLGPKPAIFVYGAEDAETILKSNTQIEKGDLYSLVDAWLGEGLLTSGGQKWRQHRKVLTPSFHFRILDQFLIVMNEQSDVFVRKIIRHSQQEKWMDIQDHMSMFAFDVICETAMGIRIGAQENSNSPYVKALKKFTELAATRLTNPLLYTDIVFFMTSSSKIYRKTLDTMIEFSKSVIAERMSSQKENAGNCHTSENGKRLAFLDMLLEHYGTDFDTDDIREHVDTFMFAGHDTTSAALSFTLYLLGLYPEVQSRLHQELDQVFQGDRNRDVTQEDMKQLRYLECVIKESQRIYSPVPLIARKLNEDTLIGKHLIPKGTDVIIFMLSLHHDPEIYPNPEAFDPDRFSPEKSLGRHPFAFVPFSAGPRNCIGQRFALMEEKVLLCHVLRKYSVISKDHRDKVRLMPVGVLRSEGPLFLRFQERETLNN